MALTVTLEGIGVIANASSTTESIGTGTNQWNEDGTGTDSWTTDTYIQGGESFAGAYPNRAGYQYYRTSTSYNFTTGGNAEGQYIYIWVNCPTIGLLENLANKGLALRIGNDLNNYREYTIAGNDDSNGWLGEWKCFVIDPNTAGTSGTGAGNFNPNNVNYIGVWMDTAANAKGDNIFIDQIAISSGLRITGTWDNVTYNGAWEEVLATTTAFATNAWGNFQSKGGIYYAQGNIYIGDSTQTAVTVFEDSSAIVQWDESQFWNGSAWVSTYPSTGAGIIIEDSASFSTQFTDGVLVGTDNGRNGSTFIGSADQDLYIDASNADNNASSFVRWYNTTFRDANGISSFHASTNSRIYGATIARCGQFVTNGSAVIRNTIFSGFTTALTTDAALLWSSGTDIQNCSFISNDYAIELVTGTSTDFTNLLFSGNTVDVNNQTGAAHTVNLLGTSNASTSSGSAVTFSATYSFEITNLVDQSEVRIINNSTNTILAGVETVGATPVGVDGVTVATDPNNTGRYKVTYTYSSPFTARVVVMNFDYQHYSQTILFPTGGGELLVSQIIDRNYINP